MNNPFNTALLILVAVFLLVAAVSVTITVTRENTLREVASAANIASTNAGTQLARNTVPSNYAGYSQPDGAQVANQATAAGLDNSQPYVPANNRAVVAASVVDSSSANSNALPSCHASGTGTQAGASSTGITGYSGRGGSCCGR